MIITALLSSALVLSPAPAASVSSVRVHDVEASYVRSIAADGTVTLSGQDNRTGKVFRLTVRDGFVRGWIGNRHVEFLQSEAKAARVER